MNTRTKLQVVVPLSPSGERGKRIVRKRFPVSAQVILLPRSRAGRVKTPPYKDNFLGEETQFCTAKKLHVGRGTGNVYFAKYQLTAFFKDSCSIPSYSPFHQKSIRTMICFVLWNNTPLNRFVFPQDELEHLAALVLLSVTSSKLTVIRLI